MQRQNNLRVAGSSHQEVLPGCRHQVIISWVFCSKQVLFEEIDLALSLEGVARGRVSLWNYESLEEGIGWIRSPGGSLSKAEIEGYAETAR